MNRKEDKFSIEPGRSVMDAAAIRRALRRIAHEIIERNPDLHPNRPRGNSVARK